MNGTISVKFVSPYTSMNERTIDASDAEAVSRMQSFVNTLFKDALAQIEEASRTPTAKSSPPSKSETRP